MKNNQFIHIFRNFNPTQFILFSIRTCNLKAFNNYDCLAPIKLANAGFSWEFKLNGWIGCGGWIGLGGWAGWADWPDGACGAWGATGCPLSPKTWNPCTPATYFTILCFPSPST